MTLLDLLKELFGLGQYSFDRTLGAMRASQWPKVRKEHLAKNPLCIVCNKKGTLLSPNEAHHIVLFSQDPSMELLSTNIATVCRRHHLEWAHLGNFKSWDKDIVENARIFRERVANRP